MPDANIDFAPQPGVGNASPRDEAIRNFMLSHHLAKDAPIPSRADYDSHQASFLESPTYTARPQAYPTTPFYENDQSQPAPNMPEPSQFGQAVRGIDPYTSDVMSYADKVKQLLSQRSAPVESAGQPVTGALPGTPPENPNQDNMTINARSGEYVFPEPAVKYYGVKKLEDMVHKAIEDINPPGQPAPEPPTQAQTYARGGLINRKHFLRLPKGHAYDKVKPKAKPVAPAMPIGLPPVAPDSLEMPQQMLQQPPPMMPKGYFRGGGVEPDILPGNTTDARVEWASRLGKYDEYTPHEASWLWSMMGGPMGFHNNPWGGGPLGSGWQGWGQPFGRTPDVPMGGGQHPHTPPKQDSYMGGYIGGYASGGLIDPMSPVVGGGPAAGRPIPMPRGMPSPIARPTASAMPGSMPGAMPPGIMPPGMPPGNLGDPYSGGKLFGSGAFTGSIPALGTSGLDAFGPLLPKQGYYQGGQVQVGRGGRGGGLDPGSVGDNPYSIPRDMLDPRSMAWYYGGMARMNPYMGYYQPGGQPGYYPPPGSYGSGQGPTYNPSYFDPGGYPWAQPSAGGPDSSRGGPHPHTPPKSDS